MTQQRSESIRVPEPCPGGATETELLRTLSLSELARRITEQADRSALAEFHDRRAFAWGERGLLRFVDYVACLRDRSLNHVRRGLYPLMIERAYDLTISKFTLLPTTENLKQKQIDCRFYFEAFLRYCPDDRPRDLWTREMWECRKFQGLVTRHFHLSCREALRRQRRQWRKFSWPGPEGVLQLRVPAHLTRKEILAWLEEHVEDDFHPCRPDGVRQIQEMLDEHFLAGQTWSYQDALDPRKLMRSTPKESMTEFSAGDLARAVAEEKAVHCDRQRPAIRALGPEELRRLVLRIFDDLQADTFDDGQIARDFGLSKATFSRFAGSRWHERELKDSGSCAFRSVPDLWRNTAKVLASSAVFIEAACEVGIWDRVQAVTYINSSCSQEGNEHE